MDGTNGVARPLVDAIIVNHDTSMFSELALRSLVASTAAGSETCRLHITVVDNHSSDDGLPSLRGAIDELGATFELSRWPIATRTLNTHGDVLRDFVLAHPEADHYLFVDCDIDFDTDAVTQTMLDELVADDSLWAIQARFSSVEAKYGEGSSLDIWAGRPIEVVAAEWSWDPDSRMPIMGSIKPRCHPGATLVRNAPILRRVAEGIGFHCALTMSQDTGLAGFYDTLGLASAVMTAASYRYTLSSAVVHHFFNASYDDVHVAARERDCRARLARFAGADAAGEGQGRAT